MIPRIDLREGGWVRVGTDVAEVVFRLDENDAGRLYVAAEAVAWLYDRSPRYSTRSVAVEVVLFANGPGAVSIRPEVARRARLSPSARAVLDARCLLEPSRRASWGTGPDVEDEQERLTSLIVAVPDERFKPDAFYEQVADAYRTAANDGVRNSAARIATANQVDVETVYGWLKEARRRGILPKSFVRTGPRGKVAADAR